MQDEAEDEFVAEQKRIFTRESATAIKEEEVGPDGQPRSPTGSSTSTSSGGGGAAAAGDSPSAAAPRVLRPPGAGARHHRRRTSAIGWKPPDESAIAQRRAKAGLLGSKLHATLSVPPPPLLPSSPPIPLADAPRSSPPAQITDGFGPREGRELARWRRADQGVSGGVAALHTRNRDTHPRPASQPSSQHTRSQSRPPMTTFVSLMPLLPLLCPSPTSPPLDPLEQPPASPFLSAPLPLPPDHPPSSPFVRPRPTFLVRHSRRPRLRPRLLSLSPSPPSRRPHLVDVVPLLSSSCPTAGGTVADAPARLAGARGWPGGGQGYARASGRLDGGGSAKGACERQREGGGEREGERRATPR